MVTNVPGTEKANITMTTATILTASAFRAIFENTPGGLGKCPSKKENLAGFRTWRKAYRKAIILARAEGKVAPKCGRAGKAGESAVMLAGKPFTAGTAKRFVETVASVWDPTAFRAALEALGYTFKAIDPLYADGKNVRVEMVCTITAAPEAAKVALPAVGGKEFSRKAAKSFFRAMSATGFSMVVSAEARTGMEFHGYTFEGNAIKEPSAAPVAPPPPVVELPKVEATPPAAKSETRSKAVEPTKRPTKAERKAADAAK